MTAIPLSCPQCGGVFQVDDSQAGQQVACPHCHSLVIVPGGFPGAPRAAPSQSGPPTPGPVQPPQATTLACPICSNAFQVTPQMAGQQVACPYCRSNVLVPGGSTAAGATQPTPERFGQEPQPTFPPPSPSVPPAPATSPGPPVRPPVYPPDAQQPLAAEQPVPSPTPAPNMMPPAQPQQLTGNSAGLPPETQQPSAPAEKPLQPQRKPQSGPLFPPGMSPPSKTSETKPEKPAEKKEPTQPAGTAGVMRYPPGMGPKSTAPGPSQEKQTTPPQKTTTDDAAEKASAPVPSDAADKRDKEPETAAKSKSPSPGRYPPGFKPPAAKQPPAELPAKEEPKSSSVRQPVKDAGKSVLRYPPGIEPKSDAASVRDRSMPADTAPPQTPNDKQPATPGDKESTTAPSSTRPSPPSAKQPSSPAMTELSQEAASSAIDSLLPPGVTPTPPTDDAEKKATEADQTPDRQPSSKPTSSVVDSLLPPGAAAESPVDSMLPPGVDTSIPTAGPTSAADALLPPGAGGPGAMAPMEQVAVPAQDEAVLAGPKKPTTTADGSILIPTEDGVQVALREPVKTVGYGEDEIELKKLTPEEKAKRKFKKNLIVWTFGAVILVITVLILLAMGPL